MSNATATEDTLTSLDYRPDHSLISLRGVSKWFDTASGRFTALQDVDLDLWQGECVAEREDDADQLDHGDRQRVRGRSRGRWRDGSLDVAGATGSVARQEHRGDFPVPAAKRRPRALALLERLDIADQAGKLPADLSGGQQQRAAIARALANDPPILVADEPTGNLDSKTADDVMSLFATLAREGKTVLVVTHERDVSRFFTRTITLADGVVQGRPFLEEQP